MNKVAQLLRHYDMFLFPPLSNADILSLFYDTNLPSMTDVFNKTSSKMPYNVYTKKEDGVVVAYVIQFPMSGFYKDEISVELDNSTLMVTFDKSHRVEDELELIHKGLSSKTTRVNFTVDQSVTTDHIKAKVNSGNGTFVITVDVPEESKPNKIEIE